MSLFHFQFDLVCDNTFLSSVASSILFASWLFMSIFSGILADKIGRKPVMIFFGVFTAVFGLLSAFPRVYWLYTVFRLLVGLGIGRWFQRKQSLQGNAGKV